MAVLRVKEAFSFTEKNGVARVLCPGDLVDSNDTAVKGREQFFETPEDVVARSVEQATAAPGEKRAVKRVTKSDVK